MNSDWISLSVALCRKETHPKTSDGLYSGKQRMRQGCMNEDKKGVIKVTK